MAIRSKQAADRVGFFARLISNHALVNISFAVVTIMGLLAYLTMPREQDPEINFNWVNITTILPGASAEDVEEKLTQPLEDAIRGVQDIKFVSSTSRENASNILVRFREISERTFDKRINDLRRELQNKARAELPDEAEDPLILEITTSNGFPTALVVLRGRADDEVLRRQAKLIEDELEQVKGVDRIRAIGRHDPEIRVAFSPAALADRGISAPAVADQLSSWYRDLSAGTQRVGEREWLVRVRETDPSPEHIAAFPIRVGEATVRLDELATISRDRETAEELVRYEGDPAVLFNVTKISYTNTLELVERLAEFIEQRNQSLAPLGLELALADDQTIPTREALDVMETNALLGLTLVLGVCALFLGLRIAALVTLGIIFSIAGALWLLQMTGNTLNVSVLLGIVIVLGMLVDDAVVVVEAIYYRLVRGADRMSAALGALREVAQPVTSAVATTMAAFLPLMLLPGIVGKFMFVIPFVVTMGLLVSLVEAFWILPSHVTGLPPRKAPSPTQRKREEITRRIRLFYGRLLTRALRRPAWVFGIALGLFLLAGVAVALGLVRMQFFAFDPLRLFYVNVDMPSDAPITESLAQAEAAAERVSAGLEPGEARSLTVIAGVKFTETEIVYGDQYAQVIVSLAPRENDMRTTDVVVEDLRQAVVATPGRGEVSFLQVSGGPPTTKPINVKVRSDDFEELRRAADAVKAIAEQIPGARDVADNDVAGRPTLQLQLDLEAVRAAGLQPAQVSRTIRLLVDGEIVSSIRDQGEKVEVRLMARDRAVDDIAQVLNHPVPLPDGRTTTLGTLTQAEYTSGRGAIRHHNLRRSISVEGELDKEVTDTVEANRIIQARWAEIAAEFPSTDLDFSGELDDIQESLDAMGRLFLLGLGLIYLILAAQFRSYFQPLMILVTVPLAFTGVVLGLLLSRNPMSLYTLYGVVALTGIAVNSAIVLIDAANARVASGIRVLHATVYAARRRVIPILMTTSTTIAGLFSLAVGLGGKSLLWGPVAASIVWGLAFASVLTLFVIPVLYRQFMQGRQRDRLTSSNSASQPN